MKTIIVGAGPASLMAATQAVKNGHEVLVFEKMKTAGRKFLVAGDGGFNLSHNGTIDDFVSYYSNKIQNSTTRWEIPNEIFNMVFSGIKTDYLIACSSLNSVSICLSHRV